jgi:hypothetical protein
LADRYTDERPERRRFPQSPSRPIRSLFDDDNRRAAAESLGEPLRIRRGSDVALVGSADG